MRRHRPPPLARRPLRHPDGRTPPARHARRRRVTPAPPARPKRRYGNPSPTIAASHIPGEGRGPAAAQPYPRRKPGSIGLSVPARRLRSPVTREPAALDSSIRWKFGGVDVGMPLTAGKRSPVSSRRTPQPIGLPTNRIPGESRGPAVPRNVIVSRLAPGRRSRVQRGRGLRLIMTMPTLTSTSAMTMAEVSSSPRMSQPNSTPKSGVRKLKDVMSDAG